MTGWAGTQHGMMAASTMPLMHAYAGRHGAEFSCVNLQAGGIPPSWVKVPFVAKALGQFDEVLWLDADVVVRRKQESIFAEVADDAVLALVEHHTECGDVPNFGVFVARRGLADALNFIWEHRREQFLNHPWWEQAAMLEQLGYSVAHSGGCQQSKRIALSPLREMTTFLSPKWNHHPKDSGKADKPNFIHVTQYDDRVGAVRRLCAEAT